MWRSLVTGHSQFASPFFAPAFTQAVSEVADHVFVLLLERGGEPVGFLPFQCKTAAGRRIGVAHRVGLDFNDFFGLITVPDLAVGYDELLRLAGLCVFHVENLLEAQHDAGLVGAPSDIGRTIKHGPDPREYWNALREEKKHFASQTERRERRLVEAHGPLRFELHTADWEEVLSHLIEVKREQYRRTGATDHMGPRWKRELLYRLVTQADPQCTGLVSTVHAGDTWVASHFGVRNGPLLHYWFPVYNTDLGKYSPGHLLIKQIIENTPAHGIHEMDLGPGDHQHKRSYVTEAYQVYRARWERPGARLAVYRAAVLVAKNLRRAMR